MPSEHPIGYAALIRRFSVPDLGLAHASYLRPSGGTLIEHHADGSQRVGYPRKYDPGDGTVDHLVFALKYDGVDLRVLRGVFEAMPAGELTDAVRAQPTSQHLRRLWFLYEWLTERALDVPDLTQGNYVPLFDPAGYVTGPERNSRRHRVRVNALGPAALCPVVRRTPEITRQIGEAHALEERAKAFLDREMREEIEFIERFDRAVEGMRATREMPDRRERLFVQCVVQNSGALSARKRELFPEVPDDELRAMERAVREAFALDAPA